MAWWQKIKEKFFNLATIWIQVAKSQLEAIYSACQLLAREDIVYFVETIAFFFKTWGTLHLLL